PPPTSCRLRASADRCADDLNTVPGEDPGHLRGVRRLEASRDVTDLGDLDAVLLEEGLEPGWCVRDQHPRDPGGTVPERMRHPARQVDGRTGAADERLELPVDQRLELELAVQDVEGLSPVVGVERWPVARRHGGFELAHVIADVLTADREGHVVAAADEKDAALAG